jgi:hypothetical protein
MPVMDAECREPKKCVCEQGKVCICPDDEE